MTFFTVIDSIFRYNRIYDCQTVDCPTFKQMLILGEVDRLPTLTVATANKIRDAILQGQLPVGAPLPELDLCKELNVSRGTVREALRILISEGLVEVSPHRGASVFQLTHQKAWEIYTLRAQLEPYAVRLALEKGAYTPADLEKMTQLVGRLGELNRIGDIVESPKVDIEFHRALSLPSGHNLLLQVLGNLQSQTLVFILHTKLYRSDLTSDDVSHGVILEAVRAGDPIQAESIVRRHIIESGISLLEHLPQSDQITPGES